MHPRFGIECGFHHKKIKWVYILSPQMGDGPRDDRHWEWKMYIISISC